MASSSGGADAILGGLVADELYAIALPIVRVPVGVRTLPWVDEVVTVLVDVSTGRAGIRR